MKFRIKYQNKVKPINIFGDAKISQLISRCKDLFKPQTEAVYVLSLDGIDKLDLDDGDKVMELQDVTDFSADRLLLLHLIVDPATQENKTMTERVLRNLLMHKDSQTLEKCLQEENVVSAADYLFLMFHGFMLCKGFKVASGEKLPKEWKIGSGGFYKITYSYKNGNENEESKVDCTASAVGGYLSITGAVLHGNSFLDDSMELEEPMEEPYQVKFKMSRYINKEHIETYKPSLIYKGIEEFKRLVKDDFASRLLSDIKKTPSIVNIPKNVKLLIVSFLDIKSVCRLSQTCRTYRKICNEERVWKNVLLAESGAKGIKGAVQYITGLKKESSRHGAAAPVHGQEFYIRGPDYQYYYDYMPDEMFDTPEYVPVDSYNYREGYEQYLYHKASENRLQKAYHSNASAESHVNRRYKSPTSQAMRKKVNALSKSELQKKHGFSKYGTSYGENIT